VDFSNESRNLQIANYLETLRLEQNMTIEQLSDASNIPTVHLKSIEEGRFARFDDFYLKMYLKKYTQTLGVDFEQLYAYALQQPVEELPEAGTIDLTAVEAAPNASSEAQSVSIETPARDVKNQRPITKVASPALLSSLQQTPSKYKPKKSFAKVLVVLFLIALIAVFLFFAIDFFRNVGNRNVEPEVQPPIIDVPDDITVGHDDDEDDELYDDEEITEPEEVTEPEPSPEDDTQIEFDEQDGINQRFNVVTSLDEVELRIEHHSGVNWVGGGFLSGAPLINATYGESNDLEETFSVENNDVFRLTAGAFQTIEVIFINGVEVPFVPSDVIGPQNFYFTFEID